MQLNLLELTLILITVQSLTHVRLFETPWTAAHQASLSSTISQSLPKLMSIALVCHPTISSSVAPFSSCPQSFPASGSALHINHRKLTKMIKWTTALCNLMKLWAMSCRATQDGWVMVESSDKTWSPGEGNGKLFSILALRTHKQYEKDEMEICLSRISPYSFYIFICKISLDARWRLDSLITIIPLVETFLVRVPPPYGYSLPSSKLANVHLLD